MNKEQIIEEFRRNVLPQYMDITEPNIFTRQKLKPCKICGKWLPYSEFNRKDGVICQSCGGNKC